MTPTGIIKRADDLGRIVIPKSVRQNAFGLSDITGLRFEIFYEKDKSIIILKLCDCTPSQLALYKSLQELKQMLNEMRNKI